MKSQIINMIFLSGAFISLFAFAEILFHKYKVRAEFTRKLVHFVTGLITLVLPFLFSSHWMVLGLAIMFFMVLKGSQYVDLLPSINAVDRKTSGAQLFPVVVYSSFLFFQINEHLLFFYLPILLLSVCDPIAALVGKKFPYGRFTIKGSQKTLMGSFAFSISAMTVSALAIFCFDQYLVMDNLMLIMAIGTVVTLSEAVVVNGYDNLSIPVSTGTALLLFHQPIIQLV